ncbi:MAG: methylated-DNA--[protein]-cysteine S-methyltransferase [Acidimicrobiales bacterium]|nr:methylated-DNA--[protein]-cysteine S-methyltransferase [Acidimicrobiales bacterium]
MSPPHLFQTLSTPTGDLTLVATGTGLRAVLWPDDEGRVSLPLELTASTSDPVLNETALQLQQYFAKERTVFDLPLDLQGTDFQRAAWQALATIPYGATWTYKQQAQHLGRPKAVRAIGAANGKNPVSIVLPCHRVIGTNGSLTGFAGGLEAKKYLLLLEGAI